MADRLSRDEGRISSKQAISSQPPKWNAVSYIVLGASIGSGKYASGKRKGFDIELVDVHDDGTLLYCSGGCRAYVPA